MARLDPILGPAGLVLASLGALGAGLGHETPPWSWIVLGTGLLLLLVFLVRRGKGSVAAGGPGRGLRGARTGGLVLAVSVLAVLALVLSHRHHLRWDLTAAEIHSLSPQTQKILAGLKEEVEALAFFQEGDPAGARVRDLLTQYAYRSTYFRFQMLDPDRSPLKAQQNRVQSYGVVILKNGSGSRKVPLPDETGLTSALLALTKTGKKVFFVTGHGEHALDEAGRDSYSQAASGLEEQNYRVAPLLLLEDPPPGPDSIVVVAGPQTRFVPREVEFLIRLREQKGRLMILLDPGTTAGLEPLLDGLGVDYGPNIIIDKRSQMLGTEPTVPVVSEYRDHPITKGFKLASFFPLARGFRIADKRPENMALTPLALTGPEAWGETDLARLHQGQAQRDEKDWPGPVPVALALEEVAEQPPEGQPAKGFRMLLFGDSDFAANAQFNLAGHRDLFLNSVAWLGEDQELISIRPRRAASAPNFLSVDESRLVFWLPVVVVPGLILLLGLFVLFRQRRKR